MENERFDLVARLSASGLSRRLVVQSLVAGALAEVGLVGLADRIEAKNSNPGVLFFELLAAKLKRVNGDCDALAAAAEEFQQKHRRLYLRILNDEAAWDADKRSKVATKYHKRITAAAERLHTLATSCDFRGAASSPVCAGEVGGFDPPSVAGCPPGCGPDACECMCPVSGGDCALFFFECLGGARAACCWFGTCVNHLCVEQCPNCCNCCPS